MSRKKLQLSELNQSTIGGRVAYIRISNGLTQDKFAEKLGTSKGNISSWENGAYQPSFDKIVLISELFPVNSDWLLHGRGEAQVNIAASKTDERFELLEKKVAQLSEAMQQQTRVSTDRRQTHGVSPDGTERRSGEDRRKHHGINNDNHI